MPVVELELSLKFNGQYLPGFPLVKRVQTNQGQVIATTKAGSDGAGVYVTVPGCDVSAALQALGITTDQALNIRLNGQSTATIALNAGGMVIVFDGLINSGATTNATINNTGATTANLGGFWAGA